MRLRHSYDRGYDLPTQMEQLSRDTTEMLLETLGSIPLVGNDIFNDVQSIFSGGSDRTTYLVGGQPRNRIDKLREIRITRGVAIATMRSLAIQMGISLAAQNRRLDSTTIGEMRTHGVPASQETSFLRLGLDRIIDLIKNAVPSDTTN